MKRKHQRGENTVFQINSDNQGAFDASTFQQKQENKRKKTPTLPPVDSIKGQQHRRIGSESFDKDAVGLRVIGGKFRGSKLQYTGDNRVRPMKDRTREAVFNLLGPAVKGKYVLDLFGGTGALLIEAVSRGAAGGTAIEVHLPTAKKLQENLQSLDLMSVCELRKTDAFFFGRELAESATPPVLPWLVFCSPPYDFYVSRQAEMVELLTRLYHCAAADSLFVVESDERFDAAVLPIDLTTARCRDYPPAKIVIFAKE